MNIKGESGNVNLIVTERIRSDSDDFYDANWLKADIVVSVLGFKANYNTEIRVDELQRFYNCLKEVKAFESNQAELVTMEEGIFLKLVVSKLGQITCFGKAQHLGNALEFKIDTDFANIDLLVQEIEAILNKFPLIGNSD